jgi:transposase
VLRRDTVKDAELFVLRHENAVLRPHLAGPVRYEPVDRLWLAALSSLIPRHRWRAVFPVTPGMLLGWHRRFIAAKWDYSSRRTRAGRPPTRATLRNLVLRLARKNAGWGHRRIQGELARLGHPIAASTVWEILHAAGIDPAPRRTGPTWREFLTAQAEGIIAVNQLPASFVSLIRAPGGGRTGGGRCDVGDEVAERETAVIHAIAQAQRPGESSVRRGLRSVPLGLPHWHPPEWPRRPA